MLETLHIHKECKIYPVQVIWYLHWWHMAKLISRASKDKKWPNDEATPNSKTDCKFLRHQNNHRKK